MPIQSPLRALHEAAGARFGEYFGCELPARFTNSREEYYFARKTAAVADKNYRAFFNFIGPDRARYLNAILTNNIKDLQPGQGISSLLLNPQGHIMAELEVYGLADRLLVVTYEMIRERTAATLDKFIIMDDVVMEDVTEQLGTISIEGPLSAKIISPLGGPALDLLSELSHMETEIAGIRCRVVRRFPGGVPGAEFITSRESLPKLWQALVEAARANGGGPIGYDALSALRLEAGIPWFGYDFDDTTIPHEAGLENSHISYTKGCYTGQEIVERVRSRGHVNRRRVGILFSGETIPTAKTPLKVGGAEVGFVTRAAFSYALERPIGMAYVRREHNSVGSKLSWAGGEAEVIALPIEPSRLPE
jgi:folate-binding protein YgfZ